MAYNATYDENDVAPSVIDTLVKVVAGVGVFGTIIGILVGLAIGFFLFKKFMK